MKKTIIKALALAAAAVATFASCTKENPAGQETQKEPAVKEGLKFTATISGMTKTVLDSDGTVGKVNWVEGDVIYINGVEYTASPDTEDPTKAEFTATTNDAEAIDGKYYASYGFQGTVSEGVVSGVLPKTQSYEQAIACAPMYAESETTDLEFYNVAAILEIEFKGANTFEKVTIETPETSCGAFTVDAIGTDTPLAFSAVDKTVTIDCGDGVTLTDGGVKFYAAVGAATYSGLTITAWKNNGTKWTVSTPAGKSIEMKANTIYPLSFTLPKMLAAWRFNITDSYDPDGNGINWCGQSEHLSSIQYVADWTAGCKGFYNACLYGSGKISYWQVDKTAFKTNTNAKCGTGLGMRGGNNGGQPSITGPLAGDYWQFETTGGNNFKAGDKIHIFYTYASADYAAAYWRIEYKDGDEWKIPAEYPVTTIDNPAGSVANITEDAKISYNLGFNITTGTTKYDYNKDVDFTVTLENDNEEFVTRLVCCSRYQANSVIQNFPNNKIQHRIAGTSAFDHPWPVIEKL